MTFSAAVLKIKVAFATDVMSPAVVQLRQQGDEGPATIIFEDTLKEHARNSDESFQELADTLQNDCVLLTADLFAAVLLYNVWKEAEKPDTDCEIFTKMWLKCWRCLKIF